MAGENVISQSSMLNRVFPAFFDFVICINLKRTKPKCVFELGQKNVTGSRSNNDNSYFHEQNTAVNLQQWAYFADIKRCYCSYPCIFFFGYSDIFTYEKLVWQLKHKAKSSIFFLLLFFLSRFLSNSSLPNSCYKNLHFIPAYIYFEEHINILSIFKCYTFYLKIKTLCLANSNGRWLKYGMPDKFAHFLKIVFKAFPAIYCSPSSWQRFYVPWADRQLKTDFTS